MMLSFDEWNVWYHSLKRDEEISKNQPWQKSPGLVEDTYTLADAVVFGTMLITLLRHADRVRIACLAQLVNVIAPIMTEPNGGRAWRQTIYWPFLHGASYGRGTVMQAAVTSPCYDSPNFMDVPYLECVCVKNGRELTVFAVNRSLDDRLPLEVKLRGFEHIEIKEHICMTGGEPQAISCADRECTVPQKLPCGPVEDGAFFTHLPPLSWNVLRFQII